MMRAATSSEETKHNYCRGAQGQLAAGARSLPVPDHLPALGAAAIALLLSKVAEVASLPYRPLDLRLASSHGFLES